MKLTDNHNYDAKLADMAIKFCKKCKICWEIIPVNTRVNGVWKKVKTIEYYKNFPSYGKEKVDCLKCEGGEPEEFYKKNYGRRAYNFKQEKKDA